MKKLTIISLIITAMLCISGCSGKSSSSSSGIEGTSAPVSSEETTEETSEASSAPTEPKEYVTNGDEGELTDKEVIDLLESTVQAGIDRDFSAFVKTSDMGISYYLSNGKWAGEAELTSFLANDPAVTAYFLMYDQFKDTHVHFVNPEKVTDEELAKINSYIEKIGGGREVEWETPLSEVRFEGGYRAYMRFDGQSEDDLTARMYVVKFNGEWKTDAYITFVMEMYGEFSDEQ